MVRHEVLPTPSHPPGTGVWTCYGATEINAPASEVWSAILDFQSYEKWNLYNPRVVTPSGTNTISPGDMITLAFCAGPTEKITNVPCQIIHVDNQNMSLCWQGHLMSIPSFIYCPEKINRVTPIDENRCRYEVYETMSGPMAYIVKWSMADKLSAVCQGMADGLKKYAEANPKS